MKRRCQVNTPKKQARYTTTIQYSISSETNFCFQPAWTLGVSFMIPHPLSLTYRVHPLHGTSSAPSLEHRCRIAPCPLVPAYRFPSQLLVVGVLDTCQF